MGQISSIFLDDFLEFLTSLLLDNELCDRSSEIRKLSQSRAELDLCNNFMLWLDLEEADLKVMGSENFDYCDMLVKFANMGMYTLIKLLK